MFDDAAWQDVRDRTQAEYEEAYQWYRNQEASEEELNDVDDAIGSISNIAHAAFHLGAIRALIPILQ